MHAAGAGAADAEAAAQGLEAVARRSSIRQFLPAPVSDDTLRVLLGQAARTFARPRFGIETYVDSMTRLYRQLLAGKGIA